MTTEPLPAVQPEWRHDSVMMSEVLEALDLKPGQTAVDGTLGLAGHGREMAKGVAPGGRFIGFDWDEAMLEYAREKFSEMEGISIEFHRGDYREIPSAMRRLGWKADGVLLDLGLNSVQLTDASRGISFQKVGPLDMRMDRSKGEPASAMLNRLSPQAIENLIFEFGDERWARAIAKAIVERRKEEPLRTTLDLVNAVFAAVPAKARDPRIHAATRTFQAVRIAVNRELEDLDEAISEIAQTMSVGGKLVVLSYHSGEDRHAKQAFRGLSETGDFREVDKKPRTPSEEEIRRNPRSRSAKMRTLVRIR